jgi:hypothetical protein
MRIIFNTKTHLIRYRTLTFTELSTLRECFESVSGYASILVAASGSGFALIAVPASGSPLKYRNQIRIYDQI